MDNFDYDAILLKLSKAKDGDMLVISSDDCDENILRQLRYKLNEKLTTKLFLVSVASGDSLALVEKDEARAILERIATEP